MKNTRSIDGTKLASKLLVTMRTKNIAINRFLEVAKIPRRSFYSWLEGNEQPLPRQKVKMAVAIEIIEECFK